MAKVERGVKSQAIQEYMAANKEANVQQIFDALKEKGINVSFGLVKAVKYGKGKKSSARKARRITAKGRPAVSASESIRQFIAKHPGAMSKEIRQGLRQQGVKVSLGLVSNVKYTSGKKKTSRKKPIRSAMVRVAARKIRMASLSIDQLIAVKRFADSLGGTDQVRKALDTLAELQ